MTGEHRGILVIISSPSGAGKTTLARRLTADLPNIEFSVSYTTRKPRAGEKNGVDYWFVDDPQFDAMVAGGQLAEWAWVHGNRYGTANEAVERALSGGHDVVFDVDGQGGCALFARWPNDALRVFILPPDLGTLADRLRRRATDDEEVILRRLGKAIAELAYHREYEHRIVNDDLDAAYAVLRALYLVRRRGPEDQSPEMAAARALVDESQHARAFEHGEKLMAAGELSGAAKHR
ncbi:MAG TPA: guanylate kinase [Kofleriaceae bacterium]|nr:guanylate kinase [Kofleriaceae bacterium]